MKLLRGCLSVSRIFILNLQNSLDRFFRPLPIPAGKRVVLSSNVQGDKDGNGRVWLSTLEAAVTLINVSAVGGSGSLPVTLRT